MCFAACLHVTGSFTSLNSHFTATEVGIQTRYHLSLRAEITSVDGRNARHMITVYISGSNIDGTQ